MYNVHIIRIIHIVTLKFKANNTCLHVIMCTLFSFFFSFFLSFFPFLIFLPIVIFV